jgi:biopolymer transport protein ExbD
MRNASNRHSLSSLSELNITPLLDLAFVLLIIFMITAPFLAESADLIIPSSKASNEAIDPSRVFTVSIDKHHSTKLDGKPVDQKELPSEIRHLKGQYPGMGIIIKAHHQLQVQQLVGVMDAIRDAGVAKVGVVTKPAAE